MSIKRSTYVRKSTASQSEESLRLQELFNLPAAKTILELQRERAKRAAAARKAKKK